MDRLNVRYELPCLEQLIILIPVEAAELARELGHSVRVGDLLRYESRAFAWQLTDAEYELVVRLVRPRRHWWQLCWPQVADPAPDPPASPLSPSV